MPIYNFNLDKATNKRTIEGILRLREGIRSQIPERSLNKRLLLATWNIRDFDKDSYGQRTQEAIQYIAEIISSFDLVAVQEIYSDLTGLNRLMAVLGSNWKYICTDTTEGSRGNEERMAFLYDSRKVDFGGLAGELVFPPVKMPDGSVKPVSQLWRTPFTCGFMVGENKFMVNTVHITWGENASESAGRIEEIKQIAAFLKGRSLDPKTWSQNIILLGDFNIFKPDSTAFKELTKANFIIPAQLQTLPSNAMKVRHYDQIAFRVKENRLETTGRAGVFDYYQHVFRENEQDSYMLDMMPGFQIKTDGTPRSEQSKKNYYKTYWRTHQMSDHLPMWVELKLDYTDEILIEKLVD